MSRGNERQPAPTWNEDFFRADPPKHIVWGFSESCSYSWSLGIGAATQPFTLYEPKQGLAERVPLVLQQLLELKNSSSS